MVISTDATRHLASATAESDRGAERKGETRRTPRGDAA